MSSQVIQRMLGRSGVGCAASSPAPRDPAKARRLRVDEGFMGLTEPLYPGRMYPPRVFSRSINAVRPFLLILSLVTAPALAAEDPAAWAGPETRILAGAALSRIGSSDLARSLLEELPVDLDEVSRATGADLRRDAEEVLLAHSGSGSTSGWLWVLRGRFPTPNRPADGTVSLADGVHSRLAAAWTPGGLLLVGPRDAVEEALARRGGAPDSLVAAAARLRASRDVWMVSEMPVAEGFRVPDPNLDGLLQGDLFQPIGGMTAGVVWGQRLAVDIEARTTGAAEAEALVEVGTFLLQLFGAQAPSAPAAGLLAALENRRLEAEGPVARFTCEVSEAALAGWWRRVRAASPASRRR